MSRTERSVEYFRTGHNCAQAVLAAFGPGFGLDAPACERIAAPFGAGISRAQEICGAVAGGVMALGLARGGGCVSAEGRGPLYEMVASFLREFEARHRSLNCRALLGIDLSTPEGREELTRRGHDICFTYVRSAAEILERMLTS